MKSEKKEKMDNENFKFPHWCGEDCDCSGENGNECPYLNGDD